MKYKIEHRDNLRADQPYFGSFNDLNQAEERVRSYNKGVTPPPFTVRWSWTADWVVVEDTGSPAFTETKPALSNIPPSAVLGVLRVFGFGNNVKYRPGDWLPGQPNERPWTAHADAAVRHLLQHLSGEVFDPESKLPHLDHAIARLIMARETDARTRGK